MAKKKPITDAQALAILAKTEKQLQQYFQLRDIQNLSALASIYWTPSYSWSDPVGLVLTGPESNGVVG
jgi:hypothetical protein